MATVSGRTAQDMDLTDRRILNILQSSFPLTEEPFQEIGRQVGIPEEEVIERIQALKRRNVVRQISAIFDTRRLGYKSSLVAMRFPPERLDRAARIVNEHPGVSHNYAREGYFNLWFTIAVPPDESLDEAVAEMARRCRAEAYRVMPTIRFFKIGVNFDMLTGEGAADDYYAPQGRQDGDGRAWDEPVPLTDFEVQAIRELQEDLPLISRPFEGMARRLGISQARLFEIAEDFRRRGIMRRYSAVLYHRRAGFKANAMVVWRVPEERAEEVGRIMARSKWVTHCYQRPTFPDWPYSHFTMIHAATRQKCEEIAREISQATGIDDYKLLYSTREYKKTRVKYFV